MSAEPEPTVLALADFHLRIRGLSPEEFSARFPHPFLLEWRPRKSAEEFRGSQTVEPGTMLPSGAPPDSARVAQVRKVTPVSTFRHITVGRTPNNDIPLSDACISKMHAYLVAPEPDARDARWQIVDVSTYGTSVNGERCKSQKPTPLLQATKELAAPVISFADLHFLFLEQPEAVLRALASLWQRSAPRSAGR